MSKQKHQLKQERSHPPRELRYIASSDARFELRESASGITIAGYAALFSPSRTNMGSFVEVIAPTAFDDALKNGDVRGLFNHDPHFVFGRTKSNTLRLSKDSRGLRYQADVPNTTWAQDLITTMRRGDIDQSSFGFIATDEDWSMDSDGTIVRTVLAANLFDVSVVTFPANPNTISKVRAQFPDGKEHISERIAALRGNAIAFRSSTESKKVDGANLPASSFAYVGDPSDPSTWSLPIHFPGDPEKTQDHIRLALAMFSRTEGIPDSEKHEVYARIVGAAKAHGIAVQKESLRDDDPADSWTDPDPYSDDDDDLTGTGPFNADDDDDDNEEDSLRADRLRMNLYFDNMRANQLR